MIYNIEERKFKEIVKYLETEKGIHTKNTHRLKTFLEAIWHITKGGYQWRLMPTYYGAWRSVHARFKRWSQKGIWRRMFEYMKKDSDLEWVMIDATIIRSHMCSAGYEKNSQEQEALGRSVGGFTTKIHASVDALGNPLKFLLTPGQVHDITQAPTLIKDIQKSYIIGDRGYDSDAFIKIIASQNCKAVIPPKSNRKTIRQYDKYLYKERNLVERFFNKIKWYRRVFSRFDKKASSFLAYLHFIGVLIWLR